MNNSSLRQSFAIDKSGRIQSVDEVARGLACDCTCPSCGESVIARQGEVREWHFAHASGTDCPGSAESALHKAAKQVLLDARGIMLPEQFVQSEMTLPDGRTGTGTAIRTEAWLDFSSVDAEKPIGIIRPDIIAMAGHTMLLVEVAVTHFIDDEKQQAIMRLGIPIIEINLASIERQTWSWDTLKEVIIDSTQLKQWYCQIDQKLLVQEANNLAMIDAWQKPNAQKQANQTNKPPRTRFRIDHKIVDVIERTYGVTVWSPYDPALIDKIKPLMRFAGGRWNSKTKNWVFPIEAKAYILGELGKLSGQEPEFLKS